MTKQERLILEKLSENPLLSQNELADMLNITRSSVSVYISHLMQQGYIRGRGYLLEDKKTIFIIGSVGIDYRTVADDSFTFSENKTAMFEDNEMTVSYGGIAKNLAENLFYLGHNVSVISAVGSDILGQELLNDCRRTGIDTSNLVIVPAGQSSTYLEVRSPDYKRIYISSSNMKLQRNITPEYLATKHHKLDRAQCIVVEDGLSSETLQYVSSNYPLTYLICSKPSRVSRFSGYLNQFNGMIAQLESAWKLLGQAGKAPDDDESVFMISSQIKDRISGPVLLCYGLQKFSFIDKNSCTICSHSVNNSPYYDYPHYRDTVAAGMMHCLLEHCDSESLLKYVGACRNIACQEFGFVNDKICPELIESEIERTQFNFKHMKL